MQAGDREAIPQNVGQVVLQEDPVLWGVTEYTAVHASYLLLSWLDPMICTPRKSESLMIWTTLAPKLMSFGTSGCNANHINRYASGAPGSRSDAGAEAVPRRLQAVVRRGLAILIPLPISCPHRALPWQLSSRFLAWGFYPFV